MTADHGVAFGARLDRRVAVPKNLGQIASVPLFMKAPGQQAAETVNRHVCTTDILPEVASQLEVDYPWEVEECPADSVTVLKSPAGESTVPFEAMVKQRDFLVERIERVFGTGYSIPLPPDSLKRGYNRVEQFLVQEMAKGGHEVIYGISTDPRFGPLLMFGLGGRYVEVFRDVRFGVLPLTPYEAGEMIRGIRGFPLLQGVRGESGADLERLEETLLRLAQLARRHPRIQELDINPFLAGAEAGSSKALDVRIRVGP